MATRCITISCSQFASQGSTSAARVFLQLAPRRYLHSTPPLDFLLPRVPAAATHHGWTSEPTSFNANKQMKRAFTSSSKRQQTTAIINPRQDDDGNDMLVEITPRASIRLKEIMSKDSNPNLALRIQVESGGCHGFQYLMSLTTLPHLDTTSGSIQQESLSSFNMSPNDPNAMLKVSPESPPFSESESTKTEREKAASLEEEDTVFAADDGSGAKIVMDGPSLELLKGSKVDFTMELIGSQFKIVDNPLATSSCGCGTSFDIKT